MNARNEELKALRNAALQEWADADPVPCKDIDPHFIRTYAPNEVDHSDCACLERNTQMNHDEVHVALNRPEPRCEHCFPDTYKATIARHERETMGAEIAGDF